MRRAASIALAILLALPASSAFASEPADTAVAAPGGGPEAASPRADRLDATDRWIVVLRAGTTAEKANERAGRLGITRDRTFRHVGRGYSARLNPGQLAALRADPDVAAVVPDAVVSLAEQATPQGVRRVFAPRSLTARIDGSDERVNADVAIVDTGIDRSHPDLNVAGGYSCTTSNPTAWGDGHGHGTHVAGTAGAIDDASGVVGVAPGVRLWSVRILNSAGDGLVSWYLCGLDWITAQRDPVDPTLPLFEVVNMSVAKTGKDDGQCGLTNGDLVHQAVCRLVASGVTVVAAAGNNSFNAANMIPANYDEVITVSALADTDGKPGGHGGSACYSWSSYDRDDSFADFSNYGDDVDLVAPGKCVWSTLPGNRYGYMSGTSMATPHVTGAAALFKASRPYAMPAEVKAALLAAGTQDWDTSTDPDGVHEPLLNVARIVALGDWTIDATSPTVIVSGAGADLQVPIYVIRAEDVMASISLSVTSPTGFNAGLSASVVGPDARTAVLTVAVPPSMASGDYAFEVHGTFGDAIRTAPVTITVDADAPVMPAPRLVPVKGTIFNTTSFTAAVTWTAGTDNIGPIARYQAQAKWDGSAWGTLSTTGPTTLSVRRTIYVGRPYTIRARAVDAAGNDGAWSEVPLLEPRVVQESSGSVIRTGTWSRSYNSSMSGGATRYARAKGASASLTFSGRGIAAVMPYGLGRGKAEIWVDGALAATVDTYARTFAARRIVFSRAWATKATHVVTVVVLGTTGRPRVDLDAFLVIE